MAGLETASEQLRAMASLPMEFHIRGLVDTLKLGDRMDLENDDRTLRARRDAHVLAASLKRRRLGEAAGPGGDYTEFEQTIVQRNHVIADNILSVGCFLTVEI